MAPGAFASGPRTMPEDELHSADASKAYLCQSSCEEDGENDANMLLMMFFLVDVFVDVFLKI